MNESDELQRVRAAVERIHKREEWVQGKTIFDELMVFYDDQEATEAEATELKPYAVCGYCTDLETAHIDSDDGASITEGKWPCRTIRAVLGDAS